MTRPRRSSRMTEAEGADKAVRELYAIAEEIYGELTDGQIPKMKIPLRTKANIRFDPKHAVWKYGKLTGVRSAKKMKGALMLLRTMFVLDFIRDMISGSKSSTLREMYYISEGWDLAKFHSQDESNLLVENGFDEDAKCILVHLKGQPSRSTRRLLKRMNEELKLQVASFTDGDPWSFRIHASVAYGAIKTAHISEFLATPTAEFVGITASDIMNYQLPTDVLTPRDIGALNAELTDPRFATEFWRTEINTMLQLGKKAEQQALAKYGLDYVTDTYLPEKLGEIGLM